MPSAFITVASHESNTGAEMTTNRKTSAEVSVRVEKKDIKLCIWLIITYHSTSSGLYSLIDVFFTK